MMWNFAGNYPMFSGWMFMMMICMLAAYIILLLAAWRLMRAHEHIAESIKEITLYLKSKYQEMNNNPS